jgi:hypothetical protein
MPRIHANPAPNQSHEKNAKYQPLFFEDAHALEFRLFI